MSFSNALYLYNHLPSRFRRDDTNLFLSRFLQWFGDQMDAWDGDLDNFYQSINAGTASQEFIEWWLWSLFGWGWFAPWMSLAQLRSLYGGMATSIAGRGTPAGIEAFLRGLGIEAYVDAGPQIWGDFTWGEEGYTITAPLGLVVHIPTVLPAVNQGSSEWGDCALGEDPYGTAVQNISLDDVDDLIRWEWPLAQIVFVSQDLRLPITIEDDPFELSSGDLLILSTGLGLILE